MEEVDFIELGKAIGTLTLTSVLGIAVVVLWRKLGELEIKLEGMVERYHTTLSQITTTLQSLADELEDHNGD